MTEIEASESGRFHRNLLLMGSRAVEKLRTSHVTVIGLGAVGSHAVEALARMGVGTIRLVDFDVVRPSNINRQLLALETTLGMKKTTLAYNRIKAINPVCDVDVYEKFIDVECFEDLFSRSTDFVIDAIDGLAIKVALIVFLHGKGIPFVSSMGAANRLDPLRITIGELFKAEGCRLAKRIRKRLTRLHIRKGIRCVYSTEPGRIPIDQEMPDEGEALKRGRIRRPMGSISFITGIFGYMAASEAFTHLTRGMVEPPKVKKRNTDGERKEE